MLKKSKNVRALVDVCNALFELGILESPIVVPAGTDRLRADLGLDSQEMVGIAEGLSSLATNCDPLDESTVETVNDLVAYLEKSRDMWLPTDVPYVLQGSATIKQDIETVFLYIADYRKWPDILAHVTKIEPEYDDGRMQSFKMNIEELTTKDNYFVQSWRYVNSEAGIVDFTQPKPPAGFSAHKGGWRFKSLGSNRTELISYHGFDLNEGINVDDSIALIRKHIQAALKTWANYGNNQ